MAQNTSPIFPLTPEIQWTQLTASNSAFDGTGTVATIFSASVSGSRVDYLKLRALGTNNSASVMRVFINNGGVNTSARNNSLFFEYPLPTTTSSSNAETGADNIVSLNISLPASYRLNGTLTVPLTASNGSGWQVTAVGGDY